MFNRPPVLPTLGNNIDEKPCNTEEITSRATFRLRCGKLLSFVCSPEHLLGLMSMQCQWRVKGKTSLQGRTARKPWLCACVRYWLNPECGVRLTLVRFLSRTLLTNRIFQHSSYRWFPSTALLGVRQRQKEANGAYWCGVNVQLALPSPPQEGKIRWSDLVFWLQRSRNRWGTTFQGID